MDLVTGSVCIAIAIISAIVIYYVLVSSLQEKTYDEVKAEHKRNSEKSLATQEKYIKHKIKDKKIKKITKKLQKERNLDYFSVVSDEVEDDVEIYKKELPVTECSVMQEANEIHATKLIPKLSCQKQSNKKTNNIQPNSLKESKPEKYLANKDKPNSYDLIGEKYGISETKDDLIGKNKKSIKLQVKSSKQNEYEANCAIVQDNFPHQTDVLKNTHKKQKDIFTSQQVDNEVEANLQIIMSHVIKTELSPQHTQVLIDFLRNNKGGSINNSEWIEGRQVLKLKKQLAEREKTLGEKQEEGIALQSKLQDLHSELNSERHMSQQLKESLQLTQADMANINSQLKLLSDDKQSLQQQIHQLQSKFSEEHHLACQLREDQEHIRSVMQQELLTQRQQLEMHIAHLTKQHQETIATLEAQIRQMASQLQEQEEIKVSFNTELKHDQGRELTLQESGVQSQDMAVQVKVSSASFGANKLRSKNETLTSQVTSTMERPATEGREIGDIYESKHPNIYTIRDHQNDINMEKLRDDILLKEREIVYLKSDSKQIESLVGSLKSELNAAQVNTDKLLNDISSYKCLLQEQECITNALRSDCNSSHELINNLREEISNQMAEITRLSKDCVRRDQLASKDHIIEKIKSELNTYKSKLGDQEAFIYSLQKELNKYKTDVQFSVNVESKINDSLVEKENIIHTLQQQSSYYQENINLLTCELMSTKEDILKLNLELKDIKINNSNLFCELETQKQKNNELRTKNWKVIYALKSAECLLETNMKRSHAKISELEEEIRLDEQQKIQLLLQRIFPDFFFDNLQEYKSWLEQFMEYVQRKSDRTIVVDLEEHNCQLLAMVTHYKNVIADTESMLNQLQSRVEEEEKRWKLHIHGLETQLEALQGRPKLQLQDGIDTN